MVIKGRRPTALNKRGNKVKLDGYTFDSQKEAQFYYEYVRPSGYRFDVHPEYSLQELTPIEPKPVKISAISYKPDFVIWSPSGKINHVYDVKNGFSVYAIDPSVKLRFRLFAMIYGIPVEAVVMRTHDFKTIAQGVTKPLNPKQPLIRTDLNYNWLRATNY